MAYFDCIVGGSGKGNTLVVTCIDDLAGETITCTNGIKTYTKTCPSTSPYEVTFYGLETGNWTLSATVSGDTFTTTVTITDCVALLGGFGWRIWVDTAQFLDSTDYESLDDVLADEKAVRELCLEHACVDYMASVSRSNADLEMIIENDLFAKWVNNSDYALDFLGANTVIKALMDDADKYFYGEWALMPQVPKMTSNTAPYGTVSASLEVSGFEAYRAFDNDNITPWSVAGSTSETYAVNQWLQYDFTIQKVISKVFILPNLAGNTATNGCRVKNYKIEASNDNFVNDIHELASSIYDASNENGEYLSLDNNTGYRYYRLYVVDNNSINYPISVCTLQFYAWQPKGNVPIMTANDAPYGHAYGISQASGYNEYRAFDGDESTDWRAASNVNSAYIGYVFPNPISVRRFMYRTTASGSTATLEYSDDNSTYTSINESDTNTGSEIRIVDIADYGYHLYWRLKYTRNSAKSSFPTLSLQFYGRELKVSVPKMDTNTTPYGEAFSIDESPTTTNKAWVAFDKDSSTNARKASDTTSFGRIGYKFVSPVSIEKAEIYLNISGTVTRAAKVQYSDDGSDWHDASNETSLNVSSSNQRFMLDTNSVGSHRYWALWENQSSAWGLYVTELNFYGKDYSEKEFEAGATKKWLYDHGVELETLVISEPTLTEKQSEQIVCTQKGSKVSAAYNQIDITSYNLFRAKAGNKGSGYPMILVINNAIYSGETPTAASLFADGNGNLPNNGSLDVSSFNGQYYVYLMTPYNASDKGYISSYTEAWLE